jgi:hypothetical protein
VLECTSRLGSKSGDKNGENMKNKTVHRDIITGEIITGPMFHLTAGNNKTIHKDNGNNLVDKRLLEVP